MSICGFVISAINAPKRGRNRLPETNLRQNSVHPNLPPSVCQFYDLCNNKRPKQFILRLQCIKWLIDYSIMSKLNRVYHSTHMVHFVIDPSGVRPRSFGPKSQGSPSLCTYILNSLDHSRCLLYSYICDIKALCDYYLWLLGFPGGGRLRKYYRLDKYRKNGLM